MRVVVVLLAFCLAGGGASARTHRRSRYTRNGAPAHPTRQSAPTPDRYKEIQQALVEHGYFKGDVNGSWGTDSVDALRRFQGDNHLTADGKLQSHSLIELGLGPARTSGGQNMPGPTAAAPITVESNTAPPQPARPGADARAPGAGESR